jgi:hypothetical protein
MATEDTARPEGSVSSPPDHTQKFVAIFVVLGALAIGEIYGLMQFSSFRGAVEAQQTTFEKNLTARVESQFSQKISTLENANAQQLEALKTELEAASKRMGSTGKELRRARAIVSKLQEEQKQQAEQLKQELARKADQQQVGALTQDVSATRADLDNTKKVLESTRSDLGMTRSEFGTLIARNHDEIEQLRKMGERDYFEFALTRNQFERVGGVGLVLKKTNLKRHRFNIVLRADDMDIEKKDRTINEPIFFYVQGSKRFHELVVNKVESNRVTGYISTPKGAVQVASRSEGAQ